MNPVKSFELSIFKNREGRWVAVARTSFPGKERTVGKPVRLARGESEDLNKLLARSSGISDPLDQWSPSDYDDIDGV